MDKADDMCDVAREVSNVLTDKEEARRCIDCGVPWARHNTTQCCMICDLREDLGAEMLKSEHLGKILEAICASYAKGLRDGMAKRG